MTQRRGYTGRDIEGAHSARGDLISTLYVLRWQLDRYRDLLRDVAALDQLAPRAQPGGRAKLLRVPRADRDPVASGPAVA